GGAFLAGFALLDTAVDVPPTSEAIAAGSFAADLAGLPFFSGASVFFFDSAMLNFSGFRLFISNHADRFARPLPSPSVSTCTLATHRQPAAMPNASITINGLKPL